MSSQILTIPVASPLEIAVGFIDGYAVPLDPADGNVCEGCE